MPRSPSAAYAFAGNRTSQISSSDPPQGGPSSSASTTPAPSNPSPRLEQRNSNNPYLSSGGRKDVSRDEYQSSRERVLLSPEMNVSQSRFRGDDVENDGLLAGASPDFNSPILNDRSAAAVAAATSPAVYRSGSARGRYSSEANDSVASLGLGLSTHNLHESESGQFNDASPSSQFYQQHHMRMTGSSSHASSLNESHQAIGGGGAGAMDGFIPTLSVTSSYASFSPSGVGAMNPLGKIGAGTDSQPGSGTSTPREKYANMSGSGTGSPPRRYVPGAFTANGGQASANVSSSDHSTSNADKFAFNPDWKLWGAGLGDSEPDDYLHNPDPARDRKGDHTGTIFTWRGLMNIGSLALLAAGLLTLFAGYPVITFFTQKKASTAGGFNLGGINATGQVPNVPVQRSLIDPDTPQEVRKRKSFDGKTDMKLVFSDEFNVEGRTFYPGDDPFWTAVDLHYWGTLNYEWYDPAAITTYNGSLVISLSETPDHNLNFRGGMLQSWNQFCFTGGYIEVSVVLAGAPDISGLWPAAWTMGNLGRAGYGATTDGLWPYTYDSCDVGTLPNQTYPASQGGGPVAAETTGVYVEQYGPGLSYLPGQRLSRCTCPNSDDHPGPKHPDGTWVGRSAPEIDIIEAAASNTPGERGHVSMSAQLAPFDSGYNLTTAPGGYEFYDNEYDSELNSYTGSVYQQAASGLVYTDRSAYQETDNIFNSYGYEYIPGSSSDAHITWTIEGKPVWKLNSLALGPNPATEIGQRPIPQEPMYIILNLGISSSFTYVNWRRLQFPATMLVDYVRVWQDENNVNIGCDPPGFPTAKYIEKHAEAYWNNNLTTWTEPPERGGYAKSFPGNSLLGQC